MIIIFFLVFLRRFTVANELPGRSSQACATPLVHHASKNVKEQAAMIAPDFE